MLDPYIGAYELRDLVLRKEVRPREIAEFFLARIERLNPRLGAFMTITGERALEDAARLERINENDRLALPLFGIAYSLKDLTWTKGIRTTMGSKNFEHYVPHADQEYAARIASAGGFCSVRRRHRNSAGVRRLRAACARRRTIRGISSLPRAVPAAGRPAPSQRGSVRSPKAATAAAR